MKEEWIEEKLKRIPALARVLVEYEKIYGLRKAREMFDYLISQLIKVFKKQNDKPKLHYSFSHNHLVPLIGFRVDLHENGDFFDFMDESVCFNIEKIENNKIYVRVYHVRYINKIRGEHLEDSNKLYEIDLSKGWDKWNVKEIKEENDK